MGPAPFSLSPPSRWFFGGQLVACFCVFLAAYSTYYTTMVGTYLHRSIEKKQHADTALT